MASLALSDSSSARVCTAVEADGRGKLAPSGCRSGVAVGFRAGNAVAVPRSAVDDAAEVREGSGVWLLAVGEDVNDTAVEVWVGSGVWLLEVDRAVGEAEAIVVLVAVLAPDVGSSVGVEDGSQRVGGGVLVGTDGAFVGVRVGGGIVGSLVGVIVGMV